MQLTVDISGALSMLTGCLGLHGVLVTNSGAGEWLFS